MHAAKMVNCVKRKRKKKKVGSYNLMSMIRSPSAKCIRFSVYDVVSCVELDFS